MRLRFSVEERFPIISKLLPSYSKGLHRGKTQGHFVNKTVFYLKPPHHHPPSFSIIFSISRLTLGENLAPEGSMQSRDVFFIQHRRPLPTLPPILHIALIYKRDVPHPSLFPLSSRPFPFGAVPYSPPTIASPVTIIFLFH